MDQKKLATWLKIIIAGVALCCVFICAVLLPELGKSLKTHYEGEFDYAFWPCLIFLWVCFIPVLAALVLSWRIAHNLGNGRAFTMENAKLFKIISILAVVDTAFFFIGNCVLLCLNMNHPGFVVFSLVIVFIGVAIAVCAAGLSHYVAKAAAMQDENDLTI